MNLETLPNEIIWDIFERLNDRDRKSLGVCCRRMVVLWREVVRTQTQKTFLELCDRGARCSHKEQTRRNRYLRFFVETLDRRVKYGNIHLNFQGFSPRFLTLLLRHAIRRQFAELSRKILAFLAQEMPTTLSEIRKYYKECWERRKAKQQIQFSKAIRSVFSEFLLPEPSPSCCNNAEWEKTSRELRLQTTKENFQVVIASYFYRMLLLSLEQTEWNKARTSIL